MIGEINQEYYCAVGCVRTPVLSNKCYGAVNEICISSGCTACHRKYPTPEQYRKEYGKSVLDDFPVWFIVPEDNNDNFHDWTLMVFAEALQYVYENEEADFIPDMYIVCACTPFGKPEKVWRPE